MSKRYIRRSAEQWATIIDQQAQSGMGIKEFCEQNKHGASTFSKWKQKLQHSEPIEQKRSVSTAPAFEPVEIVPNDSQQTSNHSTRICLTLAEGITLSIERAIPLS